MMTRETIVKWFIRWFSDPNHPFHRADQELLRLAVVGYVSETLKFEEIEDKEKVLTAFPLFQSLNRRFKKL